MKSLNQFIQEKLIIENSENDYGYQPKTKEELQEIIKQRIAKEGNKADLNDIDVSHITDMSGLFNGSEFNGDISQWDVSNVKNMSNMFYHSDFNQDISNWDVSNVKNMSMMFNHSYFNQDISNWDVSNVENAPNMFVYSPLEIKNEYKPKF